MITYTNTSLSAARRCLREYDLRYLRQLEVARDDEREPLAVGSTWHRAHKAASDGADPYAAIANHAPSALWGEKLRRLYAAYGWYWEQQDEGVAVLSSEQSFTVKFGGVTYRGQWDGVVEIDGRRGIKELKTTSEEVSAESAYWNRLRLDVQVGLYSLAAKAEGWEPEFILYDVVRKPTIRPARPGTKPDRQRMARELAAGGQCTYYGEQFDEESARLALDREQETPEMYGARLTADIGNRPHFYFGRRVVHRTAQDFEQLLLDLSAQVDLIERAAERGHMPRNPDSCDAFGRCDFFGLCGRNEHPGDATPEGFRKRERLHPELA